MKRFFCCLLFFHLSALADLQQKTEEPLFISLGASCRPAQILENCGLRKRAYPFDWILSLDNQGVILAIEEDFKSFFDEDLLIPDNYLIKNTSGANLIHTGYHFEFLHEGAFRGVDYE